MEQSCILQKKKQYCPYIIFSGNMKGDLLNISYNEVMKFFSSADRQLGYNEQVYVISGILANFKRVRAPSMIIGKCKKVPLNK